MATATMTLREQLAQREEQAEAKYREAVAKFADGKGDLAKVLSIIDEAGRSPDQFEADVQLRKQRLQAVADVQRSEGMTAEQDEAGKLETVAAQKLNSLEEEYRRKIDDARRGLQEAMSLSRSLHDQRRDLFGNARTMLLSTADDGIDEEIDQLKRSIEEKRYQLENTFEQIRRTSVIAERESAMFGRIVGHPARPVDQTHAERLAKLYQTRDNLQRGIAQAEQRIKDLEVAKMDPARQRWAR